MKHPELHTLCPAVSDAPTVQNGLAWAFLFGLVLETGSHTAQADLELP